MYERPAVIVTFDAGALLAEAVGSGSTHHGHGHSH